MMMHALHNISRVRKTTEGRGKSLFFSPATLQKKHLVGAANDPLEAEADAMADKVVQRSMGRVDVAATQKGPLVQRKCPRCEEEEEPIQMKPLASQITSIQRHILGSAEAHQTTDAVSSQIENRRGAGQAMDDSTRGLMESSFGADFSSVRIHTDSAAVQLSRDLNAQAFTVGNDVFFNEGKYDPNSTQGQHLLAHELTHTLQQGAVQRRAVQMRQIGDPIHDNLEDEFHQENPFLDQNLNHHSQEYRAWLMGRTSPMEAFRNRELQYQHLSVTSVREAFDRMTNEELFEYRDALNLNEESDPRVIRFITDMMLSRPLQHCTPSEVLRTERIARSILSGLDVKIRSAEIAVSRLHSRWINNKRSFLNGDLALQGEIACAFKSNFNIDEHQEEYGIAHIRVMRRLKQLARRLTRPIDFACEPINNPICLSGEGKDSEAYVVSHTSPIHLCYSFRNDPMLNSQEATLIHEVFHLLPGVRDEGGYTQIRGTTCAMNFKFSGEHGVLTNTADSLAEFVMHIAATSSSNIRVVNN